MATAQPIAPVNTAFAGWLDRDGTATADTVLHTANWEAFTGWKTWGFGREPLWLRITVPAALRSDELPQVLVVRPPYLDRVTFYDPTTGVIRHSGDFLPAREDALGSVVFTFEVSPKPKHETCWFELKAPAHGWFTWKCCQWQRPRFSRDGWNG
jgi:hypothetical protein